MRDESRSRAVDARGPGVHAGGGVGIRAGAARASTHWSRSTESHVVVNRGVVTDGRYPVDYYTAQPSPSQWIALGIVRGAPEVEDLQATHRMMVGNGASEQAAIEALRQRVITILPPEANPEPVLLVEVATPGEQASDWFGN